MLFNIAYLATGACIIVLIVLFLGDKKAYLTVRDFGWRPRKPSLTWRVRDRLMSTDRLVATATTHNHKVNVTMISPKDHFVVDSPAEATREIIRRLGANPPMAGNLPANPRPNGSATVAMVMKRKVWRELMKRLPPG